MVDATATRAEVLGTLKTALWQAQARLASANVGSIGIAGALAADATRINRLAPDGDLGKAVLTGALEHSRWMAIAKLTLEDISAQMVVLGGARVTWSRVWDEIVVPTAEGVAKVADVGASYIPYVLLVGGLVAVAVILGQGRAILQTVRG